MGGPLPREAVSTGDAPPILFLVLPKKRMRRARWKRKRRLCALRLPVRASARDGGRRIGASADLPGLRARLGLLRVCSCRPVADDTDGVGVVRRMESAPLFAAALLAVRESPEIFL